MVKESFDLEFIISIIPKLIKALPVTLTITVLSILLGWTLGFIITCGKISRFRKMAFLLDKLTVIVRGIPTVVLLYLVYFGLSYAVSAVTGSSIDKWPKAAFCIIALGTELSVTSSELFRSAYNSLDKSQREAAHSIGMNRLQIFTHIYFPQGLYVILPNMGSGVLAVIQGTALVYTLGVVDVLGKARILDTNAFGLKTFEAYFAVALIFWVLSLIISALFRELEKYFGRGMDSVGTVR